MILVLFGHPTYIALRENYYQKIVQAQYKQIGLIFKMYANDSEGYLFPPITKTDQGWVMNLEALYPMYKDSTKLPEPFDFTDPAHGNLPRNIISKALTQDEIDWDTIQQTAAQSFLYTGFSVIDHEMVQEVVNKANSLEHIHEDIYIRNSNDCETLEITTTCNIAEGQLLREGVERCWFSGDVNVPANLALAQSEIPTIIQRRIDPYGKFHVLFMDGHVEYMKLTDAHETVKALRKAHNMDEIFP